MLRRLATFLFNKGYVSSGLKLLNDTESMGVGSKNIIFTGTGANRVFKGVSNRAGIVGAKTLMNVGDGYGGLGSPVDTSALGSVFRVLGAIFYIGAGRLNYNGAAYGDEASSTLQLKKFEGGSLGEAYDAGLPQPSAPTIAAITPTAGLTGKNDGTVSVKVARVRSATGARSIASETSNVVNCKNQSVLVTFPNVSDNGQDYWEVDVTLNGFGGVGNHYFLQEIKESDIAGTTKTETATATSVATEITLPNSTLTTANVGWKILGTQQWKYITCTVDPLTPVGAGDAKTVVTAAGLTGTPLTLTFAVGAAATATDIATALYNKLTSETGTGKIMDLFDVYRDGATVYIKKKTGEDATLNFTLENDTSTDVPEVTTASNGKIDTWVAAVGANGSGGGSTQKVTLNTPIGMYSGTTDTVTITNATSGVARSYAIEWTDGDLAGADLAPIYDYPPPAGTFGGVLGDVTFVDGAFGDTVDVVAGTVAKNGGTDGGNAIAISEPARPESFSPDNYIFTNDAPSALLPGSQGLYWRFGKNSLGVIRYIGNRPALTYERLWTGIGVQKQANCTLASGGRLYAYTGKRGAVRLGAEGQPDTFFAAPVADDMAPWTAADVVLGYDANFQYVFYAHNQTILAYFEPMGVWCAPLDLSATLGPRSIKAMVTYNSEVYIAAGYTYTRNISSFNATTDLITATAHGFSNGDRVRIVKGAEAVLPTGLSDNVIYHVVSATANTFAVSTTSGGAAVNITDAGTGTFTVVGGSVDLYSFDTGGGMTATLVTQWQQSPLESDILSRVRLGLLSDTAATSSMAYLTNGYDTPTMVQNFNVRSGLQIPTTLRPNVRNARMWKLKATLESSGGNAGWQNIIVEGDTSGITI